jgi:hypothetical protein
MPNPLMKTPCAKCKQMKRHATDCPDRRVLGPRGASKMNVEKFAEKLKALSDEQFTTIAKVIVAQAAERKRAIEHDAASKLRVLDEVLPRTSSASVTPIAPAGQGPKWPICRAINPDDARIKCGQKLREDGTHDGDHYDPETRKQWAQQRRK